LLLAEFCGFVWLISGGDFVTACYIRANLEIFAGVSR